MSVTKDEIKFVKSATVTDTGSNGGPAGYVLIVNRQKYGLFPRVTRPKRIFGGILYRKLFFWNRNTGGETASSVLVYILRPSPAGDRFYLAKGTQTDVQSDIDSGYNWAGGGLLNSAITANDQQVSILFESNDFYIDNDQVIVINNHFLTNQTIDANVKAFESVYFNGGNWIRQTAPTADEEDVYPYGTFMGSGKVFSYNQNGNIEYVKSQNLSYTGEIVGSGNGSTTQYSHNTAHTLVKQATVQIKYTIASVQYTATANPSGTITGTHLSSGSVSNAGAISLTFDTAPDNSTNITVDYTEQSWSWSGNVLTVKTQEAVANNYATSNTYCAVALNVGDILTSADSKAVTGSGTFDLTKVTLDNNGTIEETWTCTFTSSTNFTCAGTVSGSVGSGNINSAFTPINPNVATKYFNIPSNAWGGSWQTGNTAQFKTHPAKAPLWLKEVVPAGTAAYSDNGISIELYVE
ncbi:hypothetical protein [Candidatus Magnetominusculus xianensis]|uniref:Uncharacterized protein n=1 Tax=Candidatus Magnetominusculus xianensis TaxID=1748249 RepID=A0ABR5SBF2_9BACT|nr:hypothetical protein [Candidatus Magnetominusculus xianensis]KWT77348.1 hypothetical protein ASN18_3043 [Candidatus Magnetominusculus xianensis]MBF0404969.1 hypothetical protein [Nitrospirota bacterium]